LAQIPHHSSLITNLFGKVTQFVKVFFRQTNHCPFLISQAEIIFSQAEIIFSQAEIIFSQAEIIFSQAEIIFSH
jgi:hypothetical protein